MDVFLNGPASVEYGCPKLNLAYNITIGQGKIAYAPHPSLLTVSWQPPTGRAQTNITNGNKDVTFTSDATSGGILEATLGLVGCVYTETREINVIRPLLPPNLSINNSNVACKPSPSLPATTRFSIIPSCGAVSYTYTLSGNDVSFLSNGLQSLTTSDTFADLSFTGSMDQLVRVKVKANYPGGISSTDASFSIEYHSYFDLASWHPQFYWSQPPTNYGSFFRVEVDPFPSNEFIQYYWYLDGYLIDVTSAPTFAWDWNAESMLQVKVVTICGETGLVSEPFPISLFAGNIELYPNPVKDKATLKLKTTTAEYGSKKLRDIRKVVVYDKFNNVKKVYNFAQGSKSVQFDVSTLSADIYIIEVSDGANKASTQLRVHR